MGRLKLIGEQEGGGTDDHSALENLDYANAGHTGFVPSQGEALIDILRLNQNVIRDSGGNDRITLSTASPHITLSDEVKVGSRLGLGSNPDSYTGFACKPSVSGANRSVQVMDVTPSHLSLTSGSAGIYAFKGQASAIVYSGATASIAAGLYFTALAANAGTLEKLYGIWVRTGLMNYSGPASQIWGTLIRQPMLMFSTNPSQIVGLEVENQGYSGAAFDTIGLKIADQLGAAGNKQYLIEAGPSTPYLRVVGGGDPPTNKSNLYLKFGGTLYRVVKSGSYMTLETA